VNPFQFFVSTFIGGAGVAQSGFFTFTFHNTQGFEAYVPIVITCPGTNSISAGAEVTVYRSTDGGVTWETDGSIRRAFSRPTAANQVQRADLRLNAGSFCVAVMVGGGCTSTWTAQDLTAWLVTAYN